MTGGAVMRLPRGSVAMLITKSPDGHGARISLVSVAGGGTAGREVALLTIRPVDCSISPSHLHRGLPWLLETLDAQIQLSGQEAAMLSAFLGIPADGELE